MASPRLTLSPIKIRTSNGTKEITKPLPESVLREIKIEITNLMKQDKRSRYLLGQKLDILNKERARGRSGTFMADLRELRINYHKANRLIKFYRRAQSFLAIARERDKKWPGIQDANDFDAAIQSQNADAQLAAINVLADVERDKVRQAQAARKDQPVGYKISLALSDGQKEKFKAAWSGLSESKRTSAVYRAILEAAE